jgi:uncharacterized protein YecE (DUF72 family)
VAGLPRVRFGSCSFTAEGWSGSFYPADLKPAQYLAYYAQIFDTVEIDSTFYAIPRRQTVANWYEATPRDFLFSLKVPQTITHEKVLVDCDQDLHAFLGAVSPLREKLGVLLFQFQYFNRKKFASVEVFLERLRPFLKRLPKQDGFRFALEVRNKAWLTLGFADLLREHGVALALIDHPWMPRPRDLVGRTPDPLTAGFAYLRLLGDRYAMEERTRVWDKVVVDRSRDLSEWAEIGEKIRRRGIEIMVYVNNHYAGHSPATIRLLQQVWKAKAPDGATWRTLPDQAPPPPARGKRSAPARPKVRTPALFEDQEP